MWLSRPILYNYNINLMINSWTFCLLFPLLWGEGFISCRSPNNLISFLCVCTYKNPNIWFPVYNKDPALLRKQSPATEDQVRIHVANINQCFQIWLTLLANTLKFFQQRELQAHQMSLKYPTPSLVFYLYPSLQYYLRKEVDYLLLEWISSTSNICICLLNFQKYLVLSFCWRWRTISKSCTP